MQSIASLRVIKNASHNTRGIFCFMDVVAEVAGL